MTAGGVQFGWMGEQAVVTMPTEIDAVNADAIHLALLAEVGHNAAVLIIDMSRTTFCDSAGVQVIIDTYNRASAAGTGLRLVATAAVRILTIVGIDQLMPIYPTLEEAIGAGNPGPGPRPPGTAGLARS